jgi:transcriptional regulator with XRE-family HTH domain
MSDNPGPAVRRRQLGAALRRHRIKAGLSVKDAADHLLCSPAKISRIETAQRNPTLRDVRDLSNIYGISEEEGSWLMALARESRERAWWQAFDYDPGLETLIGLEGAARTISEFQNTTIPGLLQTPEYANAVISLWRPASAAALQNAVHLRMKRQQILSDSIRPRLDYVLDEGVLRRVVGGVAVMRAQLEHLVELSAASAVDLRVIPYGAGAHKGMSQGFIILEFGEADERMPSAGPALPTVVYIEGLTGEMYVDQPAEVAHYLDVFNGLKGKALQRNESLDLVRSVSRTLRT